MAEKNENRILIQKKATKNQKNLKCKDAVISALGNNLKKDQKKRRKKLA